jgi:hypothetical protein
VPQTAPVLHRKAPSARLAVTRVAAVLITAALVASTAMAQSASSSSDGSAKPRRMPPIPNPIDLETEASATDFMQDVTQLFNDIHNDYLGFKKELKRDYHISYSMQVSIFPQWEHQRRARLGRAGLCPKR